MTQVKRSFLEKLTGAKTIEDENFGSSRGYSQPINTIYREESEISMNPAPLERNSQEETSTPGDGAEGQLTIDVYQTETDVVIKSTIAGVKPEDLDVSINNDMITIRGERKNEEQVSEENYYYQECYWGSFSRSVILPVDVIAEKIEASMKNGILTIRLPKADINKTKKIQVRGF